MAKRNTIQRQLVISSVCSLHDHPTAEEVYVNITGKYPDISKGTVYRNLNSLVETGELRRIAMPEGADRYDCIMTEHSHVHCIKCGTFHDLTDDYVQEVKMNIAALTGYDIKANNIIFNGICPICQKKMTEEKH